MKLTTNPAGFRHPEEQNRQDCIFNNHEGDSSGKA